MGKPEFIPEYTVTDYLLWEGDWELWNGLPVSMSPSPSFKHQRMAARIFGQVQRQLPEDQCENHCLAIYEFDWHVNESTVVRPDIMVLCEKPRSDFVESAPTLIVEIFSPTMRKKDRISKRDLYASEGVKFYLIFDPDKEEAQFFQLTEGAYLEIPTDSELDLEERCKIKLDLANLFDL